MSVDSPCSCNDMAGNRYSAAILRGVAVQRICANMAGDLMAIAYEGGVKSEMTLCLICLDGDFFLEHLWKATCPYNKPLPVRKEILLASCVLLKNTVIYCYILFIC